MGPQDGTTWLTAPRRSIEVRRGITRTVLLIGPWAVKVPSLRSNGDGLRGVLWSISRGISANLSEIQWSDSPGVCPVLRSAAGLGKRLRSLRACSRWPSD